MRRRNFIVLLGGAAVASPFGVRAQKSWIPIIGFLSAQSPGPWAPYVAAFRTGLNETGYVEGKNVAIEFRWAEGHYDQLPALAADLVRRQVAVLVVGGGGVLEAKAATATIPIVFTRGNVDPVEGGLVSSLAHPGGNATGVTLGQVELAAKRLDLLHQLVPKASSIAMILNPVSTNAESRARKLQETTRSFGLQLHVVSARTDQEIDAAFATLVKLRAGALLLDSDPFFNGRREQFVALAARYAVPAIYDNRDSVVAGGLMSYGGSIPEVYRQAGIYTGKILSGAKPAELPILQPTKVELVINLKTAKALGLTIPQSLLLRADEVIQ
jgi:putative tryptophan/tyrosine transport system substrate-binding protein